MVKSTRAYWICGIVAGSLALTACGALGPRSQVQPLSDMTTAHGYQQTSASILVTPRVVSGGLKTQAIVAPLTASDVNHVILQIFTLSNGFEAPVDGPDGQPLQADVPAAQLGDPVQFSELAFNTVYRIRATAYSAAGTDPSNKISDDGGSYVDVPVTNDDRPVLSTIPCQLDDVWFDGVASGVIDILPGSVRYQGSPTIGLATASPRRRRRRPFTRRRGSCRRWREAARGAPMAWPHPAAG